MLHKRDILSNMNNLQYSNIYWDALIIELRELEWSEKESYVHSVNF